MVCFVVFGGFGGPGGGFGGPGGGFFLVVSVMALPLLLLLSRNHRQDHQNHHQDHQNQYTRTHSGVSHSGFSPLQQRLQRCFGFASVFALKLKPSSPKVSPGCFGTLRPGGWLAGAPRGAPKRDHCLNRKS